MAGLLALVGAHIVAGQPKEDGWRLSYSVAYLFETKPLAQAIRSIDLLTGAKCYADALCVVRALHSRVQLLVLFAIAPHLFDEWLLNPSEPRFRDGRVRKELAAHELDVFPHLYHWYSDAVHGRAQGLTEAGLFEEGLHCDIPAVENMVFVAAKLLFGVAGWMIPSVSVVDSETSGIEIDTMTSTVLESYDSLLSGMFHPARSDHLTTTIPEDRHWPKPHHDNVTYINWFDFYGFPDRLREIHSVPATRSVGRDYRQSAATE